MSGGLSSSAAENYVGTVLTHAIKNRFENEKLSSGIERKKKENNIPHVYILNALVAFICDNGLVHICRHVCCRFVFQCFTQWQHRYKLTYNWSPLTGPLWIGLLQI